jgi:hypothetical protein
MSTLLIKATFLAFPTHDDDVVLPLMSSKIPQNVKAGFSSTK